MGRSGSAHAVYAGASFFCYVGVFGDLGDPVVPTLRGERGDVVTAYAYEDTKGWRVGGGLLNDFLIE